MKITLTDSEVNHLRVLLRRNEISKTYYGNRKHYWQRHLRIYDKLMQNEYGTDSNR